MTRVYADPGDIERGAYAHGAGGRARFVLAVEGGVVRWSLSSDGFEPRESTIGDFKSWVFAVRAVRWPGPYMQEVA